MPNDDTDKPPPGADDAVPKSTPLRWIWKFSHEIDIVKGLSLVTVLSSLAVGYFQYLGAYQEKVGNQAKEDMASATSTFTEISSAFSEIQALQQILYFDFTVAVRDKSDASEQALGTKNALTISDSYEKARIELRENIDMLARKAEVYIDWASNVDRDPASKHNVDDDPLSRSVLRDYAFDCSDKYNFPAFGNVNAPDDGKPTREIDDDKYCAIGEKRGLDDTTKPKDAFIRICTGPNDKEAKRIYWYSAKHHVLTMHYCFEAAHDKLAAARQWASKSDRDPAKESDIIKREKEISAQLDDLSQRLSAFNSLALYQMERIRVKYRPTGFFCSLPLIRNIPSARCFPVRTASNQSP
jgi:hypothetical protein